MLSPVVDDAPGLSQAPEPVLVKTTVPELAVKAFYKGILSGLARLDEVQLYTGIATPEKHRF